MKSLIAPLLFFGVTSATEICLKNENNAYLQFKFHGLAQTTKIRIISSKKDTSIYRISPNESLELLLESGSYTIEPIDESLTFRPNSINLNIEDICVKDGKILSQEPLVLKVEASFAEIEGQIVSDKSIINTAKQLDIRRIMPGGILDLPKKLEIEQGKINGRVEEEGVYKVDILWLKVPNNNQLWQLWHANVDIAPEQIFISKNGKNYLSFNITPKSNTALVTLPENSYLIRKPTYTYQNIEELIYRPAEKLSHSGCGKARVPLGEYLAECIKGDNIYRKKIVIGPYTDIGPYGAKGVEITFDELDKTDFSIIKTSGTTSAQQIFQQNIDLSYYLGNSHEKNIPVIIGEEEYLIKIQITRYKENLSMKCMINNKSFDILNLYDLKTRDILGRSLENKLIAQAPNSTICSIGGFKYTIEKNFIHDKFNIDVKALLDFDIERDYLELGDAKIFYKIYQLGQPINLLNFFK